MNKAHIFKNKSGNRTCINRDNVLYAACNGNGEKGQSTTVYFMNGHVAHLECSLDDFSAWMNGVPILPSKEGGPYRSFAGSICDRLSSGPLPVVGVSK